MILEAAREAQFAQNKFLAALKGVNLEEGAAVTNRVQEMKDRVAAREAGVSDEEFELGDMFGFETEEE